MMSTLETRVPSQTSDWVINGTTLVLGCGTPELGDDAAGVEIVQHLRKQEVPRCRFRAIGHDMLDLLERMGDADAVLFIDAVSAGGRPGTIYLSLLPSTRLCSRNLDRISTHGWDLAAVLDLAANLGRRTPPLGLIGIEMKTSASGPLTPAVAHACDHVVNHFDSLRRSLAWLRNGEPPLALEEPDYLIPELAGLR